MNKLYYFLKYKNEAGTSVDFNNSTGNTIYIKMWDGLIGKPFYNVNGGEPYIINYNFRDSQETINELLTIFELYESGDSGLTNYNYNISLFSEEPFLLTEEKLNEYGFSINDNLGVCNFTPSFDNDENVFLQDIFTECLIPENSVWVLSDGSVWNDDAYWIDIDTTWNDI